MTSAFTVEPIPDSSMWTIRDADGTTHGRFGSAAAAVNYGERRAALPETTYVADTLAKPAGECAHCGQRIWIDADDGAFVSRGPFGGFASGCSASLDRGGEGEHAPALDVWRAAAREMGRDAGRAAGSWAADGNTEPEHARKVLAMLENGDPEADNYLPNTPSLSGEWADDPTPTSLARDILGDEFDELDEPGEVADELAQAWEEGRDETFMPTCEAELQRVVA